MNRIMHVLDLPVHTSTPVMTWCAGEVLVKLLLRPVNPADVFALLGVYPGYQPKTFPATLGMEGAQSIAACMHNY
jgi:NADPH:quinone reductase-like Zn-dependent oxidoreductase